LSKECIPGPHRVAEIFDISLQVVFLTSKSEDDIELNVDTTYCNGTIIVYDLFTINLHTCTAFGYVALKSYAISYKSTSVTPFFSFETRGYKLFFPKRFQ